MQEAHKYITEEKENIHFIGLRYDDAGKNWRVKLPSTDNTQFLAWSSSIYNDNHIPDYIGYRRYDNRVPLTIDRNVIDVERFNKWASDDNMKFVSMYSTEDHDTDKGEEQNYMPILTLYIKAAIESAKYEVLDDGTFYSYIPLCRGVWANHIDKEICKKELQEVLESWLLLKLKDNDTLPIINEIDLNEVIEA